MERRGTATTRAKLTLFATTPRGVSDEVNDDQGGLCGMIKCALPFRFVLLLYECGKCGKAAS